MAGVTVLGVTAGVWWYQLSLVMFWAGVLLTIAFSIRAAHLTRQDNPIRMWRVSFRDTSGRAVVRSRYYQ